MSVPDFQHEFVSVREQLELAAKLSATAAQLRVDFQALKTMGRLDAATLNDFKFQWSGWLRYKGMYLGAKLENEAPIFGWFRDADQNEPSETFSTPQLAIKAAGEFHRTHNLSQPRYEIHYTPVDRAEHELWFRTDSPEKAVEVFCAATALEGGALTIWDRHELRMAARVRRTTEVENEEIVRFSFVREYPDERLAAIARCCDQRQALREEVSVGMKAPL